MNTEIKISNNMLPRDKGVNEIDHKHCHLINKIMKSRNDVRVNNKNL